MKMINVDLQQLVQALDAPSKQDLEGAAERCVVRGGSKILVEDLLLGLLERPDGLLKRALLDAEVDAGALAQALQPRGEHSESRNPVFSTELVQWLQDALLVASLELGQSQIDQAALILALLRNPLRYAGSHYQPLLARLDAERLRDFALSQQPQGSTGKPAAGGESNLARFTHNFTRQARDGKLDPVLCRDSAIRQMIDILARRRKNNPIVVGEAGVGKTAIVEGLALRIASGEVPAALKGVELLCLDLGLLQAGASVKGEFERRLQGVIDEVKGSPKPIILFIDEAHTLIGAGGQAGSGDAANLLKPALARGELRTIAATTWSEYKKYFEKDPALARRFQPVQLHEPSVPEAVTILRGLAPVYEKSHGIYLRDDAVTAAAELSYQARDDDQQWIGNYGALLSDTTHYTFAHLDQSTVGITARLNWTASPTLSFQLYAQPFVSTGTFRNWRELADPRAGRYEDRYRPYGGQANPDGFSYKQFNSNAVVRWEYRPGSTLFLVWQQGRLQSDANRGAFDFSRDYRDLFRAHPDNTLLVKVAYWVNP
jgi:type VI secretion system protein VasG